MLELIYAVVAISEFLKLFNKTYTYVDKIQSLKGKEGKGKA